MNSRAIAKYALIVALVIAAYYIDALISTGLPIRVAVATVAVTLTLCQLFDFKTAVFTTTVFGLLSFLFSYLHPNFTSPAFMNPVVSVIPRVLMGTLSFLAFSAIKKLTADSAGKFKREILPKIAGGAAGVLTNTALVLSMISLVNGSSLLGIAIQITVVIAFSVELVVSVTVVPAVSQTIGKRLNYSKLG